MEIWKDVVGYEGIYEVSNLGRVKSLKNETLYGENFGNKREKILKESDDGKGYKRVALYKDGKAKSVYIHRLVAYAFLEEEKDKKQVNHKDGKPHNNKLENLEWCNQKENMNHAYENQLKKNNFHMYKKEIEKDFFENKIPIRKLSEKYGCARQTISKHIKELGGDVKQGNESKKKYDIDRKELVKYFESGEKTGIIAEKYKVNPNLISRYKNLWKNGVLKL